MNAFRYFVESLGDLLVILWRFPSPVLWFTWIVLTTLLCWLTWLTSRYVYGHEYNLTLRRELIEERARHARAEAAHEAKLSVYRDAAIRQTVTGLFEEAARAVTKTRFKIVNTKTGRTQ